jgi:hypothetical protein
VGTRFEERLGHVTFNQFIVDVLACALFEHSRRGVDADEPARHREKSCAAKSGSITQVQNVQIIPR